MSIQRLCQNCLEDWLDVDDGPICQACFLEHERSIELSDRKFIARNDRAVDWWPERPRWGKHVEMNDIDYTDLRHGFHAENENGQPLNLYFDPAE